MAVPAELLPLEKHRLLDELVEGLEEKSLLWMSGYMAGLAARNDEAANATVPTAVHGEAVPTLTVLYGSQTGNARRWAERIAEEATAAGLHVYLESIGRYKVRTLKSITHLVVAISTQGDGEPPDDALAFMEFILSKRAPKLEHLHYSVLALGDSGYPEFCVAGRRLDERLAELGAHRLLDRADCDLDIETVAEPWWGEALDVFREQLATESAVHPVATVTKLHRELQHGRSRPFAAEVLEKQRITGRDTDKDVRHVELSLEGSGLHYKAGDCLGVWPRNPSASIEAMLETLSIDGDAPIKCGDEERSLRGWLTVKCEITQLSKLLLAAHAERSGDDELKRLLEPDKREALAGFLDNHQPIDILRQWPADWSAHEWVNTLRPLAPRLYSIASSPSVTEDEVHLTVARVAYERFGEPHWGAASDFLCEGGGGEARVPVYVEENPRFHLPEDLSTDVIMIGAGTGVAPFRAFLQEREETGASGRNWLFFGAQHFHSQFLYQVEWQRWLKDGVLKRLHLSFSRDQVDKVYVQDRLAERGREVFDWLEQGARLYVCGGIAMEKGVRSTLQAVAAKALGNAERAESWLSELKRSGRYSRDVY